MTAYGLAVGCFAGGIQLLMVVLMVGFAPVARIFAQSTRAASFMGALHLVLWGISCHFALNRLHAGLRALNGRPTARSSPGFSPPASSARSAPGS